MGSFVFLQFPFLLGVLAAAAPLIIHLINRQRRKRILFSTLRFLIQTDRRSARKHRLADMIVLLLRMLVLILLALALAQPVYRPAGAAGVGFGKLCLGVVIDDSMSMQSAANGVKLFDRALESARTILRNVPQDGEAFILLTSGRASDAVATPSSPPSSLIDRMGDLRASHGGRPFVPAIHDALDRLKSSKNQHKALIVISDMQKRALELSESLNRDEIKKSIQSIQVLRLKGATNNAGIQGVTVRPSVTFPGAPVKVEAQIFNSGSGDQPVQTEASLWVGDQKTQSKREPIKPNALGSISFDPIIPTTPGDQRISVRLEPDELPGDNVWFDCVHILPQMRVLLITSQPAMGPKDDTYYLRTALNPLQSVNFSGTSPVKLEVESFMTAGVRPFNGYDFVFAMEPASMPDRLQRDLQAYVEGGGHVMFFPGLDTAQAIQKGELFQKRTLLGLTLKNAWMQGPQDPAISLGEFDREHPIFNLLANAAPDLFAIPAFHARLGIDEDNLGAYTRVLCRFSDSAPALLETRKGKGFSLLWTIGCSEFWGDMQLRPLFLPLLFESLKYAENSGQNTIARGTIDDGFQIPMPEPRVTRRARVVTPAGAEQRLTVTAAEKSFDYPNPAEPGFYTVEVEAEGAVAATEKKNAITAVVNIDAKESDLRQASPDDVLAFFPKPPLLAVEEAPEPIAQRLSFATKGVPIAGWLLLLSLLCLLGEIYFSNRQLKT